MTSAALAAEARRHVWERIEPSECEDCRSGADRYLKHVYAMAMELLSIETDVGHRWGDLRRGYPLFVAIHAAVRVMHQLPEPIYSPENGAEPEESPLATAATENLLRLMEQRAGEGGFTDSRDWWASV